MKIYSAHGVNDFVVCCGYKGYMIQELSAIRTLSAEPWKVTLIDTGETTMTMAAAM